MGDWVDWVFHREVESDCGAIFQRNSWIPWDSTCGTRPLPGKFPTDSGSRAAGVVEGLEVTLVVQGIAE